MFVEAAGDAVIVQLEQANLRKGDQVGGGIVVVPPERMVRHEEIVLPVIDIPPCGARAFEDLLRRGRGNVRENLADIDEIHVDLLIVGTAAGLLVSGDHEELPRFGELLFQLRKRRHADVRLTAGGDRPDGVLAELPHRLVHVGLRQFRPAGSRGNHLPKRRFVLERGQIRRRVLESETVETQSVRLEDVVVGRADEVIAVRLVPVDRPFRKRLAVGPLVVHVQIAFEPLLFRHRNRILGGEGTWGAHEGRSRNRARCLEEIAARDIFEHGWHSFELTECTTKKPSTGFTLPRPLAQPRTAGTPL